MNDNKKYTIGELAEKTGISRRAIRFYVQNRIIPPPVGLGRSSYYTQEHLERILAYRLSSNATVRELKCDSEAPAVEIRGVSKIFLGSGIILEIPSQMKLPGKEKLKAILEILTEKDYTGED
jgi:DNA-binding transcriptional MerR regulator